MVFQRVDGNSLERLVEWNCGDLSSQYNDNGQIYLLRQAAGTSLSLMGGGAKTQQLRDLVKHSDDWMLVRSNPEENPNEILFIVENNRKVPRQRFDPKNAMEQYHQFMDPMHYDGRHQLLSEDVIEAYSESS